MEPQNSQVNAEHKHAYSLSSLTDIGKWVDFERQLSQ